MFDNVTQLSNTGKYTTYYNSMNPNNEKCRTRAAVVGGPGPGKYFNRECHYVGINRVADKWNSLS